MLFNTCILVLVISCAAYDLKMGKIPNVLILPFAIGGIAFHTAVNGLDGALFSAAGFGTGLALLVIPYVMSGMGAGDVKLMGAVGGFLGAKATFEAFLFIAIAGGVYSATMILIRRDAFRGFFSSKLRVMASMVLLKQYPPIPIENNRQRPRLKYGVAIAVGTITYLIANSYGYTAFQFVS